MSGDSAMLSGSRGHGPSATPRPCRILIVDDDDAVRAFVNRVLRTFGYQTEVATGGSDALTVLEKSGPFDLLLTDLLMPQMRGDELARRVRLKDPAIKVLYLTGFSDLLFKDRVQLWADEAFLEKPFTLEALLEAVSLLHEGHLPQNAVPVRSSV